MIIIIFAVAGILVNIPGAADGNIENFVFIFIDCVLIVLFGCRFDRHGGGKH